MDRDRFWHLIDAARKKALKEDGTWETMAKPLTASLSALETEEILTWSHIFHAYQKISYKPKLWAAAYIMEGGCSDDGFDYFRAWLTAQGKTVFLGALADPDSLAKICKVDDDSGFEFEDMLAVARDAWCARTGKPRDQFWDAEEKYTLSENIRQDIVREISYAKDIDCEWDEDDEDLEKLLPRLYRKFAE
ncbi:MAG: DUF4240 domain-containing protein [Zoogloeaceae bacterium]|nr:DUF4240 domain-containing protein [Zoogloeaceae bacterium]